MESEKNWRLVRNEEMPEVEPDEPETEEEPDAKKKPDDPGSMEERLIKNRTLTIFGEIDMKLAQDVTKKLLLMDAESNDEITIFINSPGGHVESGDTIFDIIRYVKSPVRVVGTGWVASAAALIYVATELENRYSLPNTRFLLHQPMGGTRGQASDIAIEAEEIIKMRRRLNETFAEQTGQDIDKVEEDTDRNFWMSAKEAKTYGLVGAIIGSATELE